MKYAVSKWIQKIHIVREEKKSQHIKINLILSIKKSKIEYIFLYEYWSLKKSIS